MAIQTIEVQFDYIAEALDDIADLCEHWKRNRQRDRTPQAIRGALLMAMRDTLALQGMGERQVRNGALEALASQLDAVIGTSLAGHNAAPIAATVALGMHNLAREFA